jgi:hypothetical protein
MPEVFLIFKKKADTGLENVVKWVAGPMVHVDMAPGRHGIMFTSYMFEPFSINKFSGYSPKSHSCLKLTVNETELNNIQKMLVSFVEKKVPYNYTDVFQLMFTTDPGAVVDHEMPENVQSLFCSQAMTMVLKHCLIENENLVNELKKMNSRVTTPNILYDTLLPFAQVEDETLYSQEYLASA